MSIAQLILSVDSSAAKTASVDLDKLVVSAQKAERAEGEFARANRQAETATRRMAAAVDQQAASMARVGTGFRSFGPQIQQAGFQVGDFATQVASGQSAMVAMTQQGTQFVSMFGPWGAVIGAGGAVVGALATSLFNASSASAEAADEMGRASDAASDLEGQVGGLVSVVDEYVRAIGETASAQVGASDVIVAQTQREFEAKKDLLELERERKAIMLADARSAIGATREQIASVPSVTSEAERISDLQMGPAELMAGRGAFEAGIEEDKARLKTLQDELKRTSAEAELLAISIERTDKVLGMSFEDLAADRTPPSTDRRSGSGLAARNWWWRGHSGAGLLPRSIGAVHAVRLGRHRQQAHAVPDGERDRADGRGRAGGDHAADPDRREARRAGVRWGAAGAERDRGGHGA